MIGLTKNYKGYQLKPDATHSPNGCITEIRIIKSYVTGSTEKQFPCKGTFMNEEDAEDYAYCIGAQIISGKHPSPDFIVDF